MARIEAQTAKQTGRVRKTKATSVSKALLLTFGRADTATSMSRSTLRHIAKTLGLTERRTIHLALAKLLQGMLPTYEPDDGPLSDETLETIRRLVPQGNYKPNKSLFPGL